MPAEERAGLARRERSAALPIWLVTGDRPRPSAPTAALPGSAEKLRALAQRIDLGLDPWHPEDAGAAPIDATVALAEMSFAKNVGGVHWCAELRKWRARPWWTIKQFRYQRYHLGYFRDRADAVVAVRQWRELAEEIGPKEAMLSIWASRRKRS